MSRTIDEKVVEMRFDNRDFERNVSQSMSTLDKLKSALNFDGAANAFSGISAAANKLDFSSLGGAIEGVGEKFSALETIAVGALLNIGNKVSDLAMKTVKELTLDQVTAGMSKYADKTKSVQTIMNATGQSIEEVSNQLDRLMWFTDETSYDFVEMSNSIGKFTSAGIDLEKAVTSMEGIANWAAVSGAGKMEANRAMYNISQALSAGYMRLADWKSIENANMATKEFKEMAIEAGKKLGTLATDMETGLLYAINEEGNVTDPDHYVDFKTFGETLTKGKWFTTEVLTEVLDKYGKFTDELSRVYDDITSQEGIDLTTSQIIKMANQYAEGTLDMQQAMAMTGLSAEELTEKLSYLASEEFALGRKAFAAAQEAKTFEEAIDATKDAVSSQWMRTFEILFGNYEEAKVLWTDLANELWEIFAGPLSDMNDMLSAWKNLKVGGREDFIEGIKNIYRAIRSVTDPISEAWETIFPAMTFDRLGEIVAGFKNFTESLILSEEKAEALSEGFEGIFRVIRIVKDAIGGLAGAFLSGYSGGIGKFFDGIFEGFKNATNRINDFAIGIYRVKSVLDDYRSGNIGDYGIVRDILEAYPAAAKLVDIYEKLEATFRRVGEEAAKVIDLGRAFRIFSDEGGGIAGITKVISTDLIGILGTIGDIVKVWTGADISNWLDPIAYGIRTVQELVAKLEEEVQKVITSILDEFKSVADTGLFNTIKEDLAGVAKAFSETFGPGFKETFEYVFDALKYIAEDWIGSFSSLIGEGSISLEGFFRTIDDGLLSIQNFIRTNETLASVMGGIKEAIKMIADFAKNFLSIRQVIDTYQAAGGGISGVLAVINDKLGQIFKLIGDFVKRYTGLDLTSVGKGIMLVIGTIEEAVIRLADKIATLLGWKNNPFHEFLKSSESTFGKLQALIGKFTNVDVGGIGALGEKLKGAFAPLGGIFAGFGKVLGGVWAVVQATIPLIGEALSWFGDLLVNLAEKIKGMTFGDILSIIKIILTIKQIMNFQELFGGLSDTLDKLGNVLKSWQTKLRAEAMMAIGAAILMIAGALFAISLIPLDKLIIALGAMAIALAALTVSMAIITNGLTKLFSVTSIANIRAIVAFMGILVALGKVIIDTAVAIGIIVLSIKALSGVKNLMYVVDEFTKIIAVLTVSLGVLAVVARGLQPNAFASIGTALLGLSASLVALGLALKILNSVDWSSIGKLAAAFGTVAGITVAMTALLALIKKISKVNMKNVAKSMLILAAAIAAFVAILFVLKKLSVKTLINSIGKLVVAFVGFGVAASVLWLFIKPLEKVAESLEKFGKALLYVGAGIGILGLISMIIGDSAGPIAEAAVDLLVEVMDAIVGRTDDIVEDLLLFIEGILRGLAEHTPEIVKLCIELIGGIFRGVKEAFTEGNVNVVDFGIGAGMITGLLGLVMLIKKVKLTLKDFAVAALCLAGATLLLVELGGLFAGIGWLSDKVGGPAQIDKFGKFADAIVEALIGAQGDDNRGGVLGLLSTLLVFELLFAKWGDKIVGATEEKSAVKKTWSGFAVVASLLTEAVALMDALGVLLLATGAALGYEAVVDRIKWAGEVYSAIADIFGENGGVAIMLATFVALDVLFSKVKVDAGSTWSAFATVISIVTEAVGIVDALGILFAATGLLMQAIDEYITDEDYSYMPWDDAYKSPVIGWINKAGDFFQAISEAIGKFFGGFVGGAIEGVSESLTAEIIKTLESFSSVVSTLATSELIANIAYLTGGTVGLEDLFEAFGKLGGGIASFADAVKDIPDESAEKAAQCAEIVKNLMDATPNTGGFLQWLLGEKRIDLLGSRLKSFGSGVVDFLDEICDKNGNYVIDDNIIKQATKTTELLSAMSDKVPDQYGIIPFILGIPDIGEFGRRLPIFGKGMVDYANSMVTLKDIGSAVEDTKGIVECVIELSRKVPDEGGIIAIINGDNKMDKFGERLAAFGSSFVEYAQSISKITNYGSLKTITQIAYDIVNVAAIISTLVSATDSTNDAAAKLKISDITDFGSALKPFGDNLSKYYSSIKDIDTQKFHLITVQVKELVNAFAELDSSSAGIITTFGTTITDKLANAIKGEVSVALIYDAVDNLLGSMNIRMNSFINGSVKGKNGTSVYGERIIQRLIIGLNNEEKRKLLSDAVAGVIDSIGVILSDKSEGFSENGAKLLEALGAGLGDTDAIELIKQMFVDFFEGILNDISEKYEEFKVSGANIVNNVAAGMGTVDIETPAKDVGANVNKGIAKGVEETAHVVVEAVQKVGGQMIAAQMKTLEERSPSKVAERIGRYFNEGLEYGILDSIEGPVDAARDVASGAENIVRDVLGIHSKSRLMDLIGKFFDEGFASGIIENIPMVKTAVGSLLDAVKNGVGGDQIISMIQSFGFNIPDTMISAIHEAASDPVEYGDLFGDSLFSGDLSNLSSALGMDQMQNYLTGEFQSMFTGAGSSGLEGVSDYLNAETGEGITQEFVVDGMCGNLNTYKDYAYDSYSEVAESGVDGVLDVFADKADQLGDMTIQGPTVTLVADTSQVDDALDEYAYFHGEKFDKHGELDAFLLAFDNMDDNAKLNAATQFAEHGNEDMADYLTRRRKGLLTEGDLSDLRAAQSANEAWQQAATEFSQTTKESNDLLMARLAETNENLLKIHEEIMAFRGDVSEFDNMQVVLDTGTLVGEMTPMIDEQLNNRSMTGGRMVHR